MKEPKAHISIIMPIIVIAISVALLSQQQQHPLSTVANAQIQTTNSSATEITLSISMPLSKGYVDGKIRYFLATDASDNKIAASITKSII